MEKQTEKAVLKSYGENFNQIERRHKYSFVFFATTFLICIFVVVTIFVVGGVL